MYYLLKEVLNRVENCVEYEDNAMTEVLGRDSNALTVACVSNIGILLESPEQSGGVSALTPAFAAKSVSESRSHV